MLSGSEEEKAKLREGAKRKAQLAHKLPSSPTRERWEVMTESRSPEATQR